MKLSGKAVVITGGGQGIGAALAERFRAEGSRVVTADLEGGDIRCDVTSESDLRSLIETVGDIDLFVSNAGVATVGGPEVLDEKWQALWDTNVMAHVRAARLLLPQWLPRGHGYFLQTISAAGLLTMPGSAPYSATKHAALGFAEWMSITYHDRGIRVSVLCPMGVRTQMYDRAVDAGLTFLENGALDVSAVADCAVRGIEAESFMILPHAGMSELFQLKAADYEQWLMRMRKVQSTLCIP